jgi:hypothetical protein
MSGIDIEKEWEKHKKKKEEKEIKIEIHETLLSNKEIEETKTIEEYKEKAQKKLQEKEWLEFLDNFKKCFYLLKERFKYYLDLTDDTSTILSLWTLGTLIYDNFETYPILYLGGMRGSGKSRVLKLISYLSDGKHTLSPTEAVLFRTRGQISLDEMEQVSSRDRSSIKEFLNGCYKKGMKVMRMKKVKSIGEEKQVVEEFDIYRPVAIGNIYGLENVLEDRCISVIMEKSGDGIKIRLIEDYANDLHIKQLKEIMNWCRLCMCRMLLQDTYRGVDWNSFVYQKTQDTIDIDNTNNTNDTNINIIQINKNIKRDKFFLQIYDSNVTARSLELYFPIFIMAGLIDDEILKQVIKIAQNKVEEKKQDDESDNLDILLYHFISNFSGEFEWFSMKELFNDFATFAEIDISDKKKDWFNYWWFGKALKRLGLILQKRRLGRGREIMLNTAKAREKSKMFKK